MAYVICAADGNLTTSATWRTIDSTALITEGGSAYTALSTTSQNSTGFSPGAVEFDAIAVKFSAVLASTGSVEIVLYDATSSSAVVTLTIPINDIPFGNNGAGQRGGWQLYSFGSNITLEAGKSYQVRARTTITGTGLQMMTNGTAANWQHMLRSTTPATPGAGDNMVILGLWTASGTWTQYTVTQDQTTTATVYGSGPSGAIWEERVAGILVGRSTLTWPTTSSTDIALNGSLRVQASGSITIGTSASPVQRGYTARVLFSANAGNNVDVHKLGAFSIVGQSPTTASTVNHTLLTATATSGSTASLSVADATGWTSGSRIYVCNAAYNKYDGHQLNVLSADAGTNSLNITSATIWPFPGDDGSGAVYAGCEVFLLDYNVKLDVTSTSMSPYCTVWTSSSFDAQWAYLGQCSWDMQDHSSPTLFYMDKCVHYFATTTGNSTSTIKSASTAGGTLFVRDIFSNNPGVGWTFQCLPSGGTLAGWSFDGVYVPAKVSNVGGFYINCTAGTISALRKIRMYCGAPAIVLGLAGTGPATLPSDALSGSLVVGASNGYCLYLNTDFSRVTFTNLTMVNGFVGVQFGGNTFWNVTFSQCKMLTGSGYDLLSQGAAVALDLTFDRCAIGGARGYFNGIGELLDWSINANGKQRLKFLGCIGSNSYCQPSTGTFMGGSGFTRPGAPVDIRVVVAPDFGAWSSVWNGKNTAPYVTPESCVAISDFNFTANDNRVYRPYVGGDGTTLSTTNCPVIQTDQAIYHTAAPSEKMTPRATATKFESSLKRFAVTSGSTASIGVWVYKGATYAGNQPRLIIKRHDLAGYTADTVAASMSTGTGAWENLTTTTGVIPRDAVLEVVVDCDGSTGSIYVDDWSAT